jgi:hypothetical protein
MNKQDPIDPDYKEAISAILTVIQNRYNDNIGGLELGDYVAVLRSAYLSMMCTVTQVIGIDTAAECFESDVKLLRASLHDFSFGKLNVYDNMELKIRE